MIVWFEPPYKGTNVHDGFEIVIHGLLIDAIDHSIGVVCLNEEGVLIVLPMAHVAMDWRFTRGRGWHSVDEPED